MGGFFCFAFKWAENRKRVLHYMYIKLFYCADVNWSGRLLFQIYVRQAAILFMNHEYKYYLFTF